MPLFPLFRRIYPMGLEVDCKTVHFWLDWEILQLPVVVGVNLLKNRDGAAITGGIDPLQATIKFDYIWIGRHRQESDRLMFIQVEHRHQVTIVTREECAMVIRVKSS